MAQQVDLKVGFSCNNRCIHCVVSDKISESDLSFEDIENIIEGYISKYDRINLTLTGGEITFRKDYDKIIQLVKRNKDAGLIEYVDMQTNGRMLSRDKILNETIPVVDLYLVALHSYNPRTHDHITSVPGSFAETTLALSKLSERIDIGSIAIQTVISKSNYKELKDTYKFVHEEYGIKECNITFPHPLGVAFDTNITPTYSEVQYSVNEALEYCLKVGIEPYLEALPFCVFINKLQEYLLNMHEKFKTNVVGYGGEKDGHIDYRIVSEEGYSKYDSCSKCKYSNICLGVWKEYHRLYPLNDMYSLFKQY